MNWLFVFLGGGLGACIRFGISLATYKPQSGFPTATLLSNLLACLLLSILVFSLDKLDPRLKLLIGTGICGGMSTFSTFSLETFSLIETGQLGLGLLYIASSVLGCLLIFWAVYAYANGI